MSILKKQSLQHICVCFFLSCRWNLILYSIIVFGIDLNQNMVFCEGAHSLNPQLFLQLQLNLKLHSEIWETGLWAGSKWSPVIASAAEEAFFRATGVSLRQRGRSTGRTTDKRAKIKESVLFADVWLSLAFANEEKRSVIGLRSMRRHAPMLGITPRVRLFSWRSSSSTAGRAAMCHEWNKPAVGETPLSSIHLFQTAASQHGSTYVFCLRYTWFRLHGRGRKTQSCDWRRRWIRTTMLIGRLSAAPGWLWACRWWRHRWCHPNDRVASSDRVRCRIIKKILRQTKFHRSDPQWCARTRTRTHDQRAWTQREVYVKCIPCILFLGCLPSQRSFPPLRRIFTSETERPPELQIIIVL